MKNETAIETIVVIVKLLIRLSVLRIPIHAMGPQKTSQNMAGRVSVLSVLNLRNCVQRSPKNRLRAIINRVIFKDDGYIIILGTFF